MLQTSMMFFRWSSIRFFGVTLAVLLSVIGVMPQAHAEEISQTAESAQILQAFNRQHQDAEHEKSITNKEKQKIMFLLGVLLITLVFITGGLGIAMGIYGKQVFVAHMVFAGLSISMAIVHAIVGVVWFYPF